MRSTGFGITGTVTVVCLALVVVVVVVSALAVLRERPVSRVDVAAASALELGVLVYVAVRIADLAGGHRTSGLAVVVAYLVGTLVVVPVTVALGLAERGRWGPAVVGIGAVVVAVLFARVNQLWVPRG